MGVGVAGPAGDRHRAAAGRASSRRPTCARRPRSRSSRSAPSSSPSRTTEFKQAETAGGYAKRDVGRNTRPSRPSWSPSHIAKQDIVITTALIPGRPAPRLVTRGDGRSDEAGLGDRRSRGRARRQLSSCAKPRRGVSTDNGVQDRRLPQRGRPARRRPPRRSTRATCYAFVETLIDKDSQGARGQLGRRDRQGDAADPRRRGRASELRQAARLDVAPRAPREHRRWILDHDAAAISRQAPAAADGARQRRRCAQPRRPHRRPARRGGAHAADRRRGRSLRVPARDLRAGGLRRLLRGVVGDAGAAHAADGGHQRDLLGDRRRRACWRSALAPIERGLGARCFGFIALMLASVNIFGGFLVTAAHARDVQEEGAETA